MTIYILDNDPVKCAQSLDDKSLEKMIKDIAQVLCNVHWKQSFEECASIPLMPNLERIDNCKWTLWAREYVANYKYLVELGQQGCLELNYRHEGLTEYQINIEKILLWLSNNVPDLPEGEKEWLSLMGGEMYQLKMTPFPLMVPRKYQTGLIYKDNKVTIKSYRRYYQSKIVKKSPTWTKRTPPAWLTQEE